MGCWRSTAWSSDPSKHPPKPRSTSHADAPLNWPSSPKIKRRSTTRQEEAGRNNRKPPSQPNRRTLGHEGQETSVAPPKKVDTPSNKSKSPKIKCHHPTTASEKPAKNHKHREKSQTSCLRRRVSTVRPQTIILHLPTSKGAHLPTQSKWQRGATEADERSISKQGQKGKKAEGETYASQQSPSKGEGKYGNFGGGVHRI